MNGKTIVWTSMVIMVCLVALSAGCASQQEASALGDKISKVFHSLGDAVGAFVALVVRDVSAQSRNAQQTMRVYRYTPDQGFKLLLTKFEVSPQTVAPGDRVVTTFEYVVLGSGDGVHILETCVLKQNDQVLTTLARKGIERSDGTWTGVLEFEIPLDAKPGRYTLVRQISIGRLSRSKQIGFRVK